MRQRQARDAVGEGLVRRVAVHQAGIELGNRAAVALVHEAGGLAQQVVDRRSATRRHAPVVRQHPHIGEGGHEVGDGLVEIEPALGRQHQRDEGDHRLRHRVDAEDRVRRHRRAGGAVAVAPDAPHHDLAGALDMQHGTRHRAARHLDVEEVVDPRQAGAGEAGDVRHLGVDAHLGLFAVGHAGAVTTGS